MLLGATHAISHQNFVVWLDLVVMSATQSEVKVYDHAGNREYGIFANLREEEFGKVLTLISGLDQWAGECITGRITCGIFYMTMPGGRGRVLKNPSCVGHFRDIGH